MEILLDKTNKKRIYDLNQNIKKIFPVDYLLFPSGDIICNDKNMEHMYGKIRDLSIHPTLSTSVLNLNTDKIYQVFKNNKKNNITNIEILDESFIYLDTICEKTNNVIKNIVGKHYFFHSSLIKRKIDLINEWNNYILSSSFIELDKDIPEELKNNKFHTIEMGGEKIRITRSVLPGIKGKDRLFISISENKIDNRLFNVLFKIQRDELEMYFKYSCIRL